MAKYSFVEEPVKTSRYSFVDEPDQQGPSLETWEPTLWDKIQTFFPDNKDAATVELGAREIAQERGISTNEAYKLAGGTRPVFNPEGRAPVQAGVEAAGIVGKQLPDMAPAAANTVLRVIRGGDIDTEESTLDRWINKTDVKPPDNADPNYDSFQGIGQSLGYSLTTLTSAAVAGAIGSVASPLAGGAAAFSASGSVAYRASKDQFLSRVKEGLDKQSEALFDRPLTEEEWSKSAAEFESAATKYGAWEAVPEALSNLIFLKAISAPLKGASTSLLNKTLERAAGVIGKDLPSEYLTETATGVGQNRAELEAGLTNEKLTIGDAFRQQLVPTTLVTLGLGGGGAAIKEGYGLLSSKKAQPSPAAPNLQQMESQIQNAEDLYNEARANNDPMADAFKARADELRTEYDVALKAVDPVKHAETKFAEAKNVDEAIAASNDILSAADAVILEDETAAYLGDEAAAISPVIDIPITEKTRLAVPDNQAVRTLERAAAKAPDEDNTFSKELRSAAIDRAMRSIESRNGVASQAEADILEQYGIGKPYDRIDPALSQPVTEKVPSGPRIWTGKAGDGYPSAEAAQSGLRNRQKAEPSLQWTVEQMPSGRFQVAGYGQMESTAPASVSKTAESDTQQDLSVIGDTQSATLSGQQIEGETGGRVDAGKIDGSKTVVDQGSGAAGDNRRRAELLGATESGVDAVNIADGVAENVESASTSEAKSIGDAPAGQLPTGNEPTDAATVATPDIRLKSNGTPFKTEKEASISGIFRKTPGAEVVPVAGGFGVSVQSKTPDSQDEVATAEAPPAVAINAEEGRIEVRQGKGGIAGKYLGFVDGESIPGGAKATEAEAVSAAQDWAKEKDRQSENAKAVRAKKDGIAERLKTGENATNNDIASLDLKEMSDMRWFIGAAADLFGVPSRKIRPVVADMIRIAHNDMGTKSEYVPAKKALEAIGKSLSKPKAPSLSQADAEVKDVGPNPERSEKAKARIAARKKPNNQRDSVTQFIAKMGGISKGYIQDITGDTKNTDIPFVGKLFTDDGTSPDDMASLLAQNGYITEPEMEDGGGVNRLYDLINRERSGEKVYAIGSKAEELQRLEAEASALETRKAQAEAEREVNYADIATEYGQEYADRAREYDDWVDQQTDDYDNEIGYYEDQISKQADTLSEAASYEQVRQGGNEADGNQAQDSGDQKGDGFQLGQETEAERQAREAREDETRKAEAKKKREADAKAKAEADKKATDAAVKSSVDRFELGQDADQQLSGQVDAADSALTPYERELNDLLSKPPERRTPKITKRIDTLREYIKEDKKREERLAKEVFETRMRAAAKTSRTADDDIQTTALRFVPFETALSIAKDAIAGGVRPESAQFHFRLDLTLDSADRLLEAIKNDGQDILFSKESQGVKNPHTTATLRAAMDKAFRGVAGALEKGGLIRYVTAKEVGQITGTATDDVLYSPQGRVQAFVMGGTVHFVPENISQSANVKGLMMHEIGVHLMKMNRSDKEFQSISRQAEAMLKAGNKQLRDAMDRVPDDTPAHLRTEEMLGYASEMASDLSVSKRFIAWIKAKLREWLGGIKGADKLKAMQWASQLSNDDLVYLAQAAVRSAKDARNVRAMGDMLSSKADDLAGTKVVDGKGKQKTVYHATAREFDQFSPLSHFGTKDAAAQRLETTREYEANGSRKERTIAAKLNIQNPLEVADNGLITPLSVAEAAAPQGVEFADSDIRDGLVAWAESLTQEQTQKVVDAARIDDDSTAEDIADALMSEFGSRAKYAEDIMAGGDVRDGIMGDTTALSKVVASAIEDAGYDGLVYTNDVEDSGSKSWVILRPDQVVVENNADSFTESDYRPAVVSWAKERFGNQVAPNGNPAWQNFVEWFSDSAVVNPDGTPMAVYHGSWTDTGGVFSAEMLGTNTTAASAKQGFFFASNPETASSPYYATMSLDALNDASKARTGKSYIVDLADRIDDINGRITALDNAFDPDEITDSAWQEIVDSDAQIDAPPTQGQRRALSGSNNQGVKDYLQYWDDMVSLDMQKRSLKFEYESYLSAKDKFDYKVYGGDDVSAPRMDSGLSAANVTSAYLSLQNPYIHDYQGAPWRDESYAEVIEKAKFSGNDGVALLNTYDGGKEITDIYVAFRAEQIKSSTGNTGDFSPQSPDIRYSVGRDEDYQRAHDSLAQKDKTVFDKAKAGLKRMLAPGGNLPTILFNEKIKRDSQLNVAEADIAMHLAHFDRAIKKVYGKDYDALDVAEQRKINNALKGQPDLTIAPEIREQLYKMRIIIKGFSKDYMEILQRQIDDLTAGLSASELLIHNAMKQAYQLDTDNRQLLEAKAKAIEVKFRDSTSTEKLLSLVSEKMISDAKEAADLGKDTQKAMAKVSDIASKTAMLETIQSNLDTYLHRSYRAFDDPDWPKKVSDEVHDAAADYLRARYVEGGMDDADAKIKALQQVKLILTEGTAYDNMHSFIAESKLGAKDLSVLKRRKQIAPEIRALLGEYEDAKINFTKSVSKMARLVMNQRFLDKFKQLGLDNGFLFEEKDIPIGGDVKQIAADKSASYSPLNGLYTYREIDQALVDILGEKNLEGWYKTVVKYNGMIKYGKVVLSPTTQFRNFMSAFFFSMANGHFDITHYKKAFQAVREELQHKGGQEQYVRKLIGLGVLYDNPNAGEMMDLLKDSQLEENLFNKSAFGKGLKEVNTWAQRIYAHSDNFHKAVGFENEKAMLMKYKGMTEADAEVEAAERIRNTYPTYSMIGKGIRWLRQFPLVGSFVSFPAEIIRTQYHIVRYMAQDWKDSKAMGARKAVGLAMVSSLAYGLQAVSMALSGFDDDDEEAIRQFAPPWQKNSNLIAFGRDEKGKMLYMDFSFLDPYNYLKRPLNAILRDQPLDEALKSAAADMASPFLGMDIAAGAIAEVLMNKKETGGRVFNPNAPVVDQSQAIVTHLGKALAPGIVGNVDRMAKAATDTVSPSGKQYEVSDEVAGFFGFRWTTFDPKSGIFYKAYEFQDKKRDASLILSAVARNPNKVSDDDIADAYRLAEETRFEAYEDMISLVKSAMNSGLTRQEVIQSLRNSGISQVDSFNLANGRVPPFKPSDAMMKNAINKAGVLFDKGVADEFRRRQKVIQQQFRESQR